VTLSMQNASCSYRRAATAEIKDDAPWIYSSALQGRGQIAIDMALQPHLIIPTCESSPTIDGVLDDRCWKEAASLPFELGPLTLLAANVELRAFQDGKNLYFGYHRQKLPNARTNADQDTLRRSDAFEIWLTDRRQQHGLHFGLGRDDKTFAHLSTVDRTPKVDPTWTGEWKRAILQSADEWTAEVAIPLELLKSAGIDLQQLDLNSMSRNLTQAGLEAVFLIDPGHGTKFNACTRFCQTGESPRRSPATRSFTVRLHFAEIDDVRPGQRVFDVAIQGLTVLKNFDIVRDAGGSNRPLVREFRGIQASPRVTIDLTPRGEAGTAEREPILSGVEIVEEGT
jgi:hypothetical protein